MNRWLRSPLGKAHVEMREIAEVVEQRRALAAHLDRFAAGDRQDHRQIVRRQIPERVVFGMEFSEAEPMRMDVLDLAQFAGVDQFLQLLEGRMEAQHMADHEDALDASRRRRNRPFGIGDRQRDRLFDQHVLAVLDRPDGELGVELRRQRHDDGVDVVAREQLVGRDRQAILLAGEAFGARRLASETA